VKRASNPVVLAAVQQVVSAIPFYRANEGGGYEQFIYIQRKGAGCL
jgi:hypothetical protein